MNEMQERLARAMAAYARTLPEGSLDAPFIYSHRQGLAAAALAAMREPTETMITVGVEEMKRNGLMGAWHAMIDAAHG